MKTPALCTLCSCLMLSAALLAAGQSLDAEDDLEALRQVMGPILGVKLATKTEKTEAKDHTPPQQSDAWTFIAGGVNPTVRYSRYLNQPPEFTGSYPSLPNGDMGVGLDGGPFGNWYRGSAIRVILDGQDVFAARPATRCEAREGEYGHVRLVWELGQGRCLTLHFTVPEDGRAVFARLDLEPGAQPVGRVEVRLTCYPGGFGPAYGQPSHRWAKTAQGAGEVPRDFKPAAENAFPVVPIAGDDDYVLYGDRLCSSSCLGLLLRREEHASGQVNLSNYGVATSLIYPPDTRRVHLAFFASSLETGPAERAFLAGLDTERRTLQSIPFWP